MKFRENSAAYKQMEEGQVELRFFRFVNEWYLIDSLTSNELKLMKMCVLLTFAVLETEVYHPLDEYSHMVWE